MGRYYNGDIKGKFWFAIQSSNDADFFGVEGIEPNYIEYYFDQDNLEDIKKGIDKCNEVLGVYKNEIDDFFKKKDFYTDKELAEYLEITEELTKMFLRWYARLKLGEKIYTCVKENGSCNFKAEL